MNNPAFRIGLTGGIASGKSAVADEFARLGIPVIDADLVARELVEPGQPALARIVDAFGGDVLDETGRLDRRRMRERVFADVGQRRLLESILHPAVREDLIRRSLANTGNYQILVIPLLLENDLRILVDRVLVVDVPENVQLERLQSRDRIDEATARRMLAAQTTRDVRLTAADDIITNTGDLSELRKKVGILHEKFKGLQARDSKDIWLI